MKGETGAESSKTLPPCSLCCVADKQKEFGRKSHSIPTSPQEPEQEGAVGGRYLLTKERGIVESSGSLSKGKTASLPARQVFARSHHSIYNTTCHVTLHHTTADAHHMQQNALETLWVSPE